MNFSLSEEQRMLKESVARYIREKYDFDVRRSHVEEKEAFSREAWATFAELGWLSIPFSEEHGGYGGNAVDTMVIMEEFGNGLIVEPYIATVLLFGGLLQSCNNAELQNTYIAPIIGGNLQGSFAFNERQSRYEVADIKTRAKKTTDGWILDGEKTLVLNGSAAEKLVVSARIDSDQFGQEGIGLFLVDATIAGLEQVSYRMMDGQLVSNIRLNNVVCEAVVGEPGEGYALMDRVLQEAKVAVAAEAVGIMQRLNTDTMEYARTREQFGVPISSFQALQHRMVDMFSACEQSRSLLYRTVCSMISGVDSLEVEKNILALKVMVGRSGRLIGPEAIQLHGGIGMTDELAIGHYVKRLMMINALFGDADYHLQKFSDVSNR